MNTAAALGISYRRLDYWARRGLLRPEKEGGGSGCWRKWPDDELAVARVMARLIDAGLVLDVAAKIARAAVESGELTHYVLLADAVYLSVVVDVTKSQPHAVPPPVRPSPEKRRTRSR